MTRDQIINTLIQSRGYTSYLEIGCQKNRTFNRVECLTKVGVDPEMGGTHRMTSDEYFNQNDKVFDIIFIDGLHHHDQVLKDIKNAQKVINPRGVILLHDMLPTSELMQRVPREVKEWTGDGWKAFVDMRATNIKGKVMFVINTDYGIGYIGGSENGKPYLDFFTKLLRLKISDDTLTWENFDKNKQEWMNIITVEDFISML